MDTDSHDSRGGDAPEEIDDAVDSFRRDQWVTYVVMVTAGLLVSALLVGTLVNRIYINSDKVTGAGAAYPDSKDGATSFLEAKIIPQLEMKYSTKDHPDAACAQDGGFEASAPGEYESKVRCERADTIIEIDVEVIHDGDTLRWNSGIADTTPAGSPRR